MNRGKKEGRALWPGLNRPGQQHPVGKPPDQEHSRDAKQSANQEDPDRRHVGKRLVPSAPHSRESQRRNQRPEQTAEDSHHDEEDIPLRSSHAAASLSSLPRIHPNRSASHGCHRAPFCTVSVLARFLVLKLQLSTIIPARNIAPQRSCPPRRSDGVGRTSP